MQPSKSGQIKGIMLDDVIPESENVCFIKCDAQGGDLDALIGLSNTIQRCHPSIAFEWEEHLSEKIYHRKLSEYEDFFSSIKYKMEIVNQIRDDTKDYLCTPAF